MPCGKKPLVKAWDKPRNLRVITPSRYEQNEASVKVHWKNVIRELELSYKDEQFWESNSGTVRELVGPVVFKRISKIFNLPRETKEYQPKDSTEGTPVPSEQYYTTETQAKGQRSAFSMSAYELSFEEEELGTEEEETSEPWSESTISQNQKLSQIRTASRSVNKSMTISKMMSKSFSRVLSKKLFSSTDKAKSLKSLKSEIQESLSTDESPFTLDDLEVREGSKHTVKSRRKHRKGKRNPFFDMLYCNESETDMIKWNSKYKQKVFEVSASDEFSKKAEIMSKQIAKEFYDWWVALGNVEFKSEIKRPEDIEDLFQIWFDEHASRGLVLHPKILPCVLKTIADYVGVPKTACPKVLKRQIAFDIHGETTPAHTMAFGTSLPQKMKHIPPKNNTQATWQCVKIPEDLRSMACVWEDIAHLTSTKEFYKWLQQRPQLPMPPFFEELAAPGDKKQLFVVPSDYVVKEAKSTSATTQDLALPVSQFSLELKEVLSRILNQ